MKKTTLLIATMLTIGLLVQGSISALNVASIVAMAGPSKVPPGP